MNPAKNRKIKALQKREKKYLIILIRLSDNKTFQKVLKLPFTNKGTFVGNIKFIKNKKYQKTILLLLEIFFFAF